VLTAVKELRFSAPFESRDLVGFEHIKRCPHSFTRESSASSIDSLGSGDDSYIPHKDTGAVMWKQEDPKYMEDLVEGEHGDYGPMKLAVKIAKLLSALPDSQLVSFR